MARNERTSKVVASKAAKLLRNCTRLQKLVAELLEQARSVAGSALTQTRDKRRVP